MFVVTIIIIMTLCIHYSTFTTLSDNSYQVPYSVSLESAQCHSNCDAHYVCLIVQSSCSTAIILILKNTVFSQNVMINFNEPSGHAAYSFVVCDHYYL
jgi:hypothetical protein